MSELFAFLGVLTDRAVLGLALAVAGALALAAIAVAGAIGWLAGYTARADETRMSEPWLRERARRPEGPDEPRWWSE